MECHKACRAVLAAIALAIVTCPVSAFAETATSHAAFQSGNSWFAAIIAIICAIAGLVDLSREDEDVESANLER